MSNRLTSVLLYSGGVDSYCTAALYQPDVLLHVNTGTRYGDAEAAMLRTPPGMEDRLQSVSFRDLAQWERDDVILPARNAHLVLAAAQYGNIIMLGATANDVIGDKSQLFAHRMTLLLQELYAPQWWLPDGSYKRVELPIKQYTKRQLVAAYLAAGLDGAALAWLTFSCYEPNGMEPCLRCKPCTRRYTALLLNGITPDTDCREQIVANVAAIRAGTWDRRAEETADTMAAYELIGTQL